MKTIIILITAFAFTSCAQLEKIPFTVSYTDDQGETISIATEYIPIHRTK
jgi:hypothetical protein